MTSQEILRAFRAGKISLEEAKEALASVKIGRVLLPDTSEEHLQAREAEASKASQDSRNRLGQEDAIAIVGMSGTYPDARNLSEYWDNLVQAKNGIREMPLSRFDVSNYYDPSPAASGKIYCKGLGALDEIEYFDALFFHLSPAEAEVMDPQQRLFLEEGYKAFEDAGYSPELLSNRKCGVYLGITGYEYGLLLSQQKVAETNLLGTSPAIAAARIAYLLNLKGPAIAIDTACSSSLVATHLACRALAHQEIDMALVGGVALYLTPDSYIGMCSAGMLSPDGQCKPFDASADGFVPGEGVGALVLKRLANAEADHDQIYGVIIGSGTNQDGATNGITAPSVKSQIDLEREIYDKYHIDPDSISYVEMHGTGTKLGDPIELEALATVFQERTQRKRYCAIGSVKSNIGHTSAAAGVAGLQKVLLSMQQKKLVPSLHFQRPNPHFDFASSPFYVNTEVRDWHPAAAGVPLRAAISSFGFSGTNAHLVVEEYLQGRELEKNCREAETPSLFVLSAKSEQQLKSYAQAMKHWIQAHEEQALRDIAFTLQVGRQSMEHRLAIVANSRESLLQKLDAFTNNRPSTDLYTAQIKKNTNEAALFASNADEQSLLHIWCQKKNLKKMAQFWVKGASIDWQLLSAVETGEAQDTEQGQGPGSAQDTIPTAPTLPHRVSLPTYPFARELYWIPPTRTGASPVPTRGGVPLHPLVQRNISTLWKQQFSSTFYGDEFFLTDHLISGQRIMPGVAYLEMARAAVAMASSWKPAESELVPDSTLQTSNQYASKRMKLKYPSVSDQLHLSNVVWEHPLTCDPAHPVTIYITLSPQENGAILFVISQDTSCADVPCAGSWGQAPTLQAPQEKTTAGLVCCQGTAQWCADKSSGSTAGQSLDLSAVQARCQHQISGTECYQHYRALGLNYGLAFQAIEQLNIGDGEVLARFRLPSMLAQTRTDFVLHPSLLDAALHASIGLAIGQNAYQGLHVPFALDEMEIIGEMPTQGWTWIRRSARYLRTGDAEIALGTGPIPPSMVDIDVCDDEGRVVVCLRGLNGRQFLPKEEVRTLLLTPEWQEEAVSPSHHPEDAVPLLVQPLASIVLLCDLPEISASRIESQMAPGGYCRHLSVGKQTGASPVPTAPFQRLRRDLCFQDILVQLIQTLRELLQSRSAEAPGATTLAGTVGAGSERGPMRVQVVVAQKEEPSLLEALGSVLKVAQQEYPTLRAQLIEVEGKLEEDALLVWLRENQLRIPYDPHIRYRNGKRWVRQWQERQEGTVPVSLPWKEGGCYLISGGTGGLARLFVQEIARHVETATVILFGRSPLSAEQRAQLETVGADRAGPRSVSSAAPALGADPVRDPDSSRGIHRDYQQVDVTDERAVHALIQRVQEKYGHLNGIIHAAGVVRNTQMLDKTAEEVLAVLAPKVIGAELLDEASRQLPLDFFLLCSSLSAILGGRGLVDYAGANAYLDAFAHARRAKALVGERGGTTLSINWPHWEEGGMHVEAEAVEMMRELLGEEPMGTETGMKVLYHALALDVAQVVVLHGQVERIKEQLQYRFSQTREGMAPEHKKTPSRIVTEEQEAITTRGGVDIEEKASAYFKKQLAAIIKLPVQRIDASAPLEDYGFTSIMAIRFTNALEGSFGPLSKALLFEHPTLHSITEYFQRSYPAQLKRVLGIEETYPPSRSPEPTTHAPQTSVPQGYTPPCDIAIVGIAGRYPGARDLDAFWENLRQGRDCITEIPPERWDHRLYFNADKNELGTTGCKWGGFLEGVDEFDPLFFNISPKEAQKMDPQERLFLECVYAALEDAGYTREGLSVSQGNRSSRNVGVFVGVMYEEYQLFGVEARIQGRPIALAGSPSSIANRVSYFCNFHGPSLAVDTACSSSLTAIHLACQSIQHGGCEVAIAGGVNVSIHPNKYVFLEQGKFVSSQGRCESFGQGADGYVPAEGVGAVLLKPLAQAEADRDHIYGIIKAAAINHGGKTNGYTVPNPQAQAEVIERAIKAARIDPRTISYVEAHGTGTVLGDPIEIAGLTRAFTVGADGAGLGPVPSATGEGTQDQMAPGWCAIGSVKSNIGHAESAAGIAGVTKVLLQMHYGQLVPSLHAEVLNPHIDFSATPFVVQRELSAWKQPQALGIGEGEGRAGVCSIPRRAGVSSFGAGGSNAHIVLEEYVENRAGETCPHPDGKVSSDPSHPALIVLSARTEGQLHERVQQLLNWIQEKVRMEQPTEQVQAPNSARSLLNDLTYTLQVGREAMEERLALQADSLIELEGKLREYLSTPTHEGGDWYRGQVKRNDPISAFVADEDGRKTVEAWMSKGKYEKLLEWWVKGLSVDWGLLYTVGAESEPRLGSAQGTIPALPRRISLPTYPFARQRYWFPASREMMRAEEMVTVYPECIPSCIQGLQNANLSQDMQRGSIAAETRLGMEEMEELLTQLLWGYLQSLGLFRETEVALTPVREQAGISASYDRWLQASVAIFVQKQYLHCYGAPAADGQAIYTVTDPKLVDSMSLWQRWNESKEHWMQNANLNAWVVLVETMLRALPAILTGKRPATEIMFPDGSLQLVEGIYQHNVIADAFNEVLARLLVTYLQERLGCDRDARIRILEIGAGTGGTTNRVLQMVQPYQAAIAEYCYSDISASFLRYGQRMYGEEHPYLTYQIFDVEKPLTEQGIEPGSYDVVIAANVLHATSDIRRTMRNTKAVLKKHGLLLLSEMTSTSLLTHLTFGLLSGWWAYADPELRVSGGPALTAENWEAVLRSAEFGVEMHWEEQNAGQLVIVAESDGVVRQPPVEQTHRPPPNAESTRTSMSSNPLVPVGAGRYHRDLHVESITTARRGSGQSQDAVALNKLHGALAHIVSHLLNVQLEEIDVETPLPEYGFDSITSLEFANRLNQTYQLDLTPPLFYEYSTIERLARYLLTTYAAILASHFAETQPDVTPQKDLISGDFKPVSAVTCEVSSATTLPKSRSRLARSFAWAEDAPVPLTASPIAIIGMSGAFPQAPDVQSFWQNLLAGRDCISEIPTERWDWQTYFGNSTTSHPHKTNNIKWAGIMEGIENFDPLFFSIPPSEAEQMDPQHRLLMMCVWKAIEDAGYSAESLSGTDTALFVGTASSGYSERVFRAAEGSSSTSLIASVGPSRMSYFLNLHGPSEPIETACSSSLVAIHRGVNALESGQCVMAIVGGVNTLVSPETHLSFSKAGILCEDGRCKTFSAAANGYVRGEGVGMLVLKRLSDAEQDGDHIYAVIRASAENHGGRASSLTAPNPRAQADLLIAAYRKAGIDPRTVGYIEAHGTGTVLGDPIEINGLKTAFSELAQTAVPHSPYSSEAPIATCGIGTVKSNIGHLELAAGVAGVIKVLLQLQHKQLVKSLHCEQLNPYIQLEGSPFYIVREKREWEALRDQEGNPLPRRAGVSSFGFGGVNAHVVLEEYVPEPQTTSMTSDAWPHTLIVLSAKNAERLQEQVRLLLAWVQAQDQREALDRDVGTAACPCPPSLRDLAYTLQVGRTAMEERLALQVSSFAELEEQLRRYLQDPQGVGKWYRGQVRRNDVVGVFAADEDGQKTVVAWMRKGKYEKLLELWVKGLSIDWKLLYEDSLPGRISLPTYPFACERYWIPASPVGIGVPTLTTTTSPVALHPLVQRNISTLWEQQFSSTFHGNEFFLADHVISGQRIMPGVAHLEMVYIAVREAIAAKTLHELDHLCLTHVVWLRPLIVEEDPTTVHVTLEPHENGTISFLISRDEACELAPQEEEEKAAELLYSQGQAVLYTEESSASQSLDLATVQARCQHLISAIECYQHYRKFGFDHGPAFQGIEQLHVGEDEVLARLRLPVTPEVEQTSSSFVLHPSILDAALQSSIGLWLAEPTASAAKPQIPFALEELSILGQVPAQGWVWVRRRSRSAMGEVFDIDVCDDEGHVALRLRGLSARELPESPDQMQTALLTPNWQEEAITNIPLSEDVPLPVKSTIDPSREVQLDALRETLLHTASRVVKVRAEKINTETELSEYGFDSITFTEFADHLNQTYQLGLTAPLFFEHSTIERLALYLQTAYASVLAPHFAPMPSWQVTPVATNEVQSVKAHSQRRTRLGRLPNPLTSRSAPPVAIIGISGAFPQAPDVQSFWHNLLAGKDCISEIPAERWDWQTYFGNPTTSNSNKTNVKWAGIMEGVETFDPLFFGISPHEAEQMDPQQRLLMMYVWKAIEDAGYSAESLSGTNTALFVGTGSSGYSERVSRGHVAIEGHSSTGLAPSVGPNRMSYFLNLHGPSEPIDTACSSSLIAIHRGVTALESDQCTMAIVGGVNTLVSPELHISFSRAGMLSEDGRSKTFSAQANGYVRGEGVGMLVLKRLADAEQAGDHIYAVIRASAENHGGRASSLTAPNPRAQADLLATAYRKAGIAPHTVGYIEAHGTGTPLGDPIEINGLKTAFSELALHSPGSQASISRATCGIGSVKSNIGHLELAAGVAGVIKVLLQLQHKKLVKSLHCEQINPYIQLEGSPFYIVQENCEWEALRDQEGNPLPRRAGVSSFGFGGANAHVVLEEYLLKPQATRPQRDALPKAIIVLSAKNEERLREQVLQLLAWLAVETESRARSRSTEGPVKLALDQREARSLLDNLAYTLQVGRTAMEERLALQISSLAELEEKLYLYLREPQETGSWYRGQVRRNDIVDLFAADEDGQQTVIAWMHKGKYGKLLELWVNGGTIDWKYLYTVGAGSEPGSFPTALDLPQRISLPTYPFAHERYWLPLNAAETCRDCGLSLQTCACSLRARSLTSPTVSSLAVLHPLVQRNISTLWEQQFSSTFHGNEFFLADHVISGQRIMPGVAHLEMVYIAVREAIGADAALESSHLQLSHVVWIRPLIVGEQPVTVHITLAPQESGTIEFLISRAASGEREATALLYSQGRAVLHGASPSRLSDSQRLDLAAVQARCQHQFSVSSCYQRYRESGLDYGPAYQGIEQLSVGEGEALARLCLPATVARTLTNFVLHPSLLDAALQASIELLTESTATVARPHLPFALEELSIIGEVPASGWAWVRQRPRSATGQVLDIDVCDDEGYVVLRIRGLSTRELPGNFDQRRTVLLTPVWKEETITSSPSPEETSLPVRQLVLLCDLPGIAASRIQTQLVGSEWRVLVVDGREAQSHRPRRERRFQDAVVQLIQEIRLLVQSRPAGLMLVQVVVARREEPTFLEALASVLKTAQQEYPQLRGQLIEVQGEPAEGELLALLLENRRRMPQEPHIRYRNGERWVSQWQEHPEATTPPNIPWKEGGCYLITGGAGGLARLFVQEIARHVEAATIILIGRSALSREQQAQLERTGKRGINVDYQQVDVGADRASVLGADPELDTNPMPSPTGRSAVHTLIQKILRQYGHLNGIIHAAGVLRDSLLLNKTAEEVQAVLAPKVIGVELLDEASSEIPLDFFVLCSSLASVVGNVGQADYASANAYLDAFAHARAAKVLAGERQGTTVSINWPLWEEGGMQIKASQRQMMQERLGIEVMGTQTGMKMFYQALTSGQAQVLVLHGQIERIKQGLWLRSPELPVGAGRKRIEASPIQPQSQRVESITDPDREGRQAQGTIPTGALREALTLMVSRLVKVQVEKINAEAELSEYGFDSITFTEFANRLNQTYQLDLTTPLFFEHSTIERLAHYLQATHAAVLAPHFAPASPHPQVTPVVPEAIGKVQPIKPPSQRRIRLGHSAVLPTPATASPIAIIGMSGMFPLAPDVHSFWHNLLTGRDCISEIPASRWDWQTYFGNTATVHPAKTNVKWAGVIEGVEAFDPLFFGISPREAEQMDPQQRLLMMYVWKVIEDAGYSAESLSGTNTALFIGTASSGYGERVSRARMAIEGYSSTGQIASVGPNRMSYFLNLHGPSEPIETACSSSLIAIHRGVNAIESGQCSMAIVGGINCLVSPEMHLSFSKAGMLSEDGRCKTFGASANGYVRGEGVGMLVLKKLTDAEQDGDHIYAVIRASAENHGGRASSLTAPNPRAQADLLIAAYRKAGIDPYTVGYIEAHGTGTPLGDPIEINGLKTAFSELAQTGGSHSPYSSEAPSARATCGIGSVKSNIGHLELAAGVAGVIKVLLQLQHKQLVKSLHCEQINPYIQLEGSPFYIVQENREWEVMRDQEGSPLPRRAGVSSFGFGGANAHVVLEEYVPQTTRPENEASPEVIIVLSAKNEERLREQVRQLLVWVQAEMRPEESLEQEQGRREAPNRLAGTAACPCPPSLRDLAYTLQVGRDAMEERLAFLVNSFAELQEKLVRYLQEAQAAGDWYRGQAKQYKETVSLLNTDEELQEAIDKWLQRGQYKKLMQWWVKGLKISWSRLYGEHLPHRISLPTYPFMQERYWVDGPVTRWDKPQGQAPLASGTIQATALALEEAQPLQAGTSVIAQTMLLTPDWQEEEILRSSPSEEIPLVSVVLLCGLTGIEGSYIQTQMAPGGRCHHLHSQQARREQRFQDIVWQLIQEIQPLQRFRSAGSGNVVGANSPVTVPSVVQVVVGSREEPALLAALAGVLKTAQLEYPKLWGQLIEIEGELTEEALLVLLRENQRHMPHEPHIRYRNGKRWVRQWQEQFQRAHPVSLPWKEGGCYLISGGAGGLARLFVQEMAQHVESATVVLVGRSALSAIGADRAGPLWEAQGSGTGPRSSKGIHIDYRQVDVSDGPAVHTLIQRILQQYGHLDGIIHAAGVLRDSLLLNKTQEDVQAVLSPKVTGVEHLNQASSEIPLDFFILCSSIVAVMGSVGQADYAAANAYLDAFAHERAARVMAGERYGETVSLNWPLWEAGGMQIEAAARQVMREQMGIEAMETEAGMSALYQALALKQAQVIVLHGDLTKIRKLISGASWQNDSTPRQASAVPLQVSEELHTPVIQASPLADQEEARAKIFHQMKVLLADVTKLSPDEIDVDEPLENYGIDSLMMTFLNQRFLVTFKDFSRTLFYEYPTLSTLGEYLLVSYPEECMQWIGTSEVSTRQVQDPIPLIQNQDTAAIAIIGISGRYPQAPNLEEYWEILKAGKACITEVPHARWDWRDYYHSNREEAITHRKSYSKWGAFLADFAQFDPLFFQMTPRDAQEIDPQERLFLEECWKALEDAGYAPSTLSPDLRRRTGVFGGITKQGFNLYSAETPDQFPATSFASLVNRVSHHLNLQGPSTVVDAMCSSALVAIHEACEYIRQGKGDMALAGAVNLYLHPSTYIALSRNQTISDTERSAVFAQGGNGFVPGEGVGVIVLKAYDQAIKDGDGIYAVIRGSAVNHNGSANGSTMSDSGPLAAVIQQALEQSALDPRSISYIEAAASGSERVDALELAALIRVFGERESGREDYKIGSVKPTVGHSEAASGMAQVTKVVLSLTHKTLVPTLTPHTEDFHPTTPFHVWPFQLQREVTPWKRLTIDGHEVPRRAGITSVGAGGVNAHLIVEEYIPELEQADRSADLTTPTLFALSAKSKERLEEYVRQWVAYLQQKENVDLANIAYTLQRGREEMLCRLILVTHHQEELIQQLTQWLGDHKNTEDCYFSQGNISTDEREPQIAEADDLRKLAKAWVAGNTVAWNELHQGKQRGRITGLPTYPFKRRTCWIERPQVDYSRTEPSPVEDAIPQSRQEQENKAVEFYTFIAEQSKVASENQAEYLTFCPFAEKVPGFSLSQVFLHPEKYPDEQRLMHEKQTEMRQVLFCQEDFQQVHTLLDIGCGHGTDVIQVAAQYPHITTHGFTITQAQAELGWRRIAELNLSSQAHIWHKDSSKDPFPAMYDLIIGIEVTFHIQNKAGLFHNIASSLNENGKVLLMDYIVNLRGAIVDSRIGVSIPTQQEWLNLLTEHHLVVDEIVDVSPQIAYFLDDPYVKDNVEGLPRVVQDTYISYANQAVSLANGWISYCLFKLKKDTQRSTSERRNENAYKITHKTPYPQALATMLRRGHIPYPHRLEYSLQRHQNRGSHEND